MPEFVNRKYVLELGQNVVVPFTSIFKAPLIKIGDYSRINGDINIRGDGVCVMGKYCAIGYDVRILTSDHEHRFANLQVAMQERMNFDQNIMHKKNGVTLGNAVWIGDNVTLLSDIKIGDGAIVGAGSVVSKDVPDFAIVAGNPAKMIKYRFSKEVGEYLKLVSWWNWSNKKIKKNDTFFSIDLSSSSVKEIAATII